MPAHARCHRGEKAVHGAGALQPKIIRLRALPVAAPVGGQIYAEGAQRIRVCLGKLLVETAVFFLLQLARRDILTHAHRADRDAVGIENDGIADAFAARLLAGLQLVPHLTGGLRRAAFDGAV